MELQILRKQGISLRAIAWEMRVVGLHLVAKVRSVNANEDTCPFVPTIDNCPNKN